jgi:hypothetical protein
LSLGPKGPLADAVLRLLRGDGFAPTALQRGEDVAARVPAAEAIVVLDAASSQVTTDYRHALAAVLAGEADGQTARVVAVTLVPVQASGRKAFFSEAQTAEALLLESGHPLTVIRAGVIIGEPDYPGPNDSVLVGRGGLLLITGDGAARIRPILLDDLAKMVVAAVQAGEGTAVVHGEGPDEVSVDALLRTTRPGARLVHASPSLERALRIITALAGLMPGILVITRESTSAGSASGLGFGVAPLLLILPLALAGALWFALMRTSGVVPSEDLLLSEAAPPSRTLGVTLRRFEEIWDDHGHRRRQNRPKRGRGAQAYARLRATYSMALFLLLFGVLAFVVGGHDLAAPSGLGPKLAAFVVLLGALTMLFGGVVLPTRWRSRYPFAFLASLVAVATTIIVPLSAAVNGDGPLWVYFAAFYVLLFALACAGTLARLGSLDVFNFLTTSGLKVLGSVLLGGTIAAVVQVLYSSVYVPSTVMPRVSAEVTSKPGIVRLVGHGPKAKRRLPVTLTITLRNVSKQPLIVLAAPYALYATRRAPKNPRSRSIAPHDSTPRLLPADARREIYVRSIRRIVLGYGALVPRGTTMEAGQAIVRHVSIMLAPGWDAASIRGDFALIRRRYEDSSEWVAKRRVVKGVRVVDAVNKIDDAPWIHRLTRSPRHVHVQDARGYALPCSGGPAVHADISSDPLPDESRWCDGRGRLEKHYGLTYGSFIDDLPLGPGVKSA